MIEGQKLTDIQASLFKSLRDGYDLAPETPSEVETLLDVMATKGVSLGTDAENAVALVAKALASNFKGEVLDFGNTMGETEVELARAARGGKQKIPKEIEDRMRKDREKSERENDKRKA